MHRADYKKQVFDYFTATLGIPMELAVREEDAELDGDAFPHLADNIAKLPVNSKCSLGRGGNHI